MNDITVIIPTRNKVSLNTFNAIPKNIKVCIATDTNEIKGQTALREYYARQVDTKYL